MACDDCGEPVAIQTRAEWDDYRADGILRCEPCASARCLRCGETPLDCGCGPVAVMRVPFDVTILDDVCGCRHGCTCGVAA